MRAIALALLFLTLASPPAAARVLAQWVQLGPETSVSIRAITDGRCPDLLLDTGTLPMRPRAEPTTRMANVPLSDFPVWSCEATLPAGARRAAIEGKELPLPRPDPQRILLFGDTGCRLKPPDEVQDCNDPVAWPFATIARSAAAMKPDLVVHVGDYHYREDACPVGRKGCEGSPLGYGWEPWRADFFDPAAPLLASSPWLMVRGNHEDCARAGEGWFRFLDRAPLEPECRTLTGIFTARLGSFGLINFDNAAVVEPKSGAAAVADRLADQFRAGTRDLPAESWLVSHRPLDGIRNVRGRAEADSSIFETALGKLLPASVRLTIAGHIHFFQAVDFGGVHAPQLVVGTGGDNLDPPPPPVASGAQINGLRITRATSHSGFGYTIWEKQAGVWAGRLYDMQGLEIGACRLEGRSLDCGG